MHETMRRENHGGLIYYTCDRLQGVRHGFTTKAGGVSTGDCASLNLGFARGDRRENVLRNYELLAQALSVPLTRLTMTQQVHEDHVAVVTEETVGTGLHRPMDWRADALVTALPDVPLAGYWADCVVTLLYDPKTRTAGVCHGGWRGTARGIVGKTAETMARELGAQRESLVAVVGPSIGQCCFETDADVPEAMERTMGERVQPFIEPRGGKYYIDLQGITAAQLTGAGLRRENIVLSGLCTRCRCDEFWSHRATNGRRGVQAAVICL